MDSLIFLLNIIFLIISVVAILSYYSSYRETTKKASTLAKEIQDLKEDEVDFELINDLEVGALNEFFTLSNLNEPIKKIELNGEVEIQNISFSSGASSNVVSIAGVYIQVPNTLSIEKITQASGDLFSVKAALIGEKFYLLSIGDFSLVAEFESKRLEKETQSAIQSGQAGKIENLPLEVLSSRSASDIERLYFDPVTPGKRYAFLMIILFVICALVIGDTHSYVPWLVSYSAILFAGFSLWRRSRKRPRNAFQITRMIGQFNEISVQNGQSQVQVVDENGNGEISFILPDVWESKLDQIPLNQKIKFEILSDNADVVSIEKTHSLQTDFKVEPNNKHFFWGAITLFALILNTLAYTNIQYAKLAFDVFNVSSIKAINSPDDWRAINQIGQQIYTNALHRKCILSHEGETEWFNTCNQFNVSDEESHIDLLSSISRELEYLSKIDSLLSFDYMDYKVYNRMHSRAFYAGQVTRVPRRKDIFQYNYLILHNWAIWMNDNNIDNEALKKEIVTLWNNIQSTQQCEGNCWEKVLAYKKTKNTKLVETYIRKYDLKSFFEAKEGFIKQQVTSILSTWSHTELSNKANFNANLKVQLITSNIPENAWQAFLHSTSLLAKQSHYWDKKTGAEFVTSIQNAVLAIQEMQEENITYGIVSSITSKGDSKVIEVDMTMDTPLYHLYLTKIVLLIMGMLGLGIMLILFLKQRTSIINHHHIDD